MLGGFGRKLDFNYKETTHVSAAKVKHCKIHQRPKRCLLNKEEDVTDAWRRYFEGLVKSATITPPKTQEVNPGKQSAITRLNF